MSDNIFVSAVIVAGGKGTRMNMNESKQFMMIGDMPVLSRTISAFENSQNVSEIVVVVNEEDVSFCEENIVNAYNFRKVTKVVAGGKERQYSVYNGISNTNSSANIVLIHDGARPFITEDVIRNTIDGAIEHSSAVCAVKVKDTIKVASSEGIITKTLERDSLWSIQTPQAFKRNVILAAHEKAQNDNFLGTDDAVLVEQLGIATKIVLGNYLNIKITTQEDLLFAQAIINRV